MSQPANSSHVWWKHGVFYQVYPRSFMDSNADGVGDLPGITQRLDYLVKLGVDALWISPIFKSPMADFGYDISDYTDIDPLFGTLADFDHLLQAAHDKGLKIVLDYVPNHTSDEHPWFVEARSSRENPRRDWYIWRDPAPNGGPPNNWESIFGGSAWQFDEPSGQYYLHQFLEKQPDLNWRNPAVRAAMYDVLRFWLERGVDGFRMDVVHHIMKHPDFPDNPMGVDPRTGKLVQEHRYDLGQPEVHERLREMRHIFDAYPGERVTIGETWFFDPKELAAYYGAHLDELHLPFNFITLDSPWQAPELRRRIDSYYAALPPGATPNFVFGNHDRSRLATRYGYENRRGVAMLLLTLRGVPTMYYGDELGMEDVLVPPHLWQDPVMLRKPDSGEGRDPERAPMPWDASPNAGFTASHARPWLPLPANYRQLNAAAQMERPDSTLTFYQHLLYLRRHTPALQYGDFAFVGGVPEPLLAYLRSYEADKLLVLINTGDQDQHLDLSHLVPTGRLLLTTLGLDTGLVDLAALHLRPHEALLIRLTTNN